MMFTKFLRCVSTLLVVVMLANMVPVQALGNPQAENTGLIEGTEIIGTVPSESLSSADEAAIVGEIADGRTQNIPRNFCSQTACIWPRSTLSRSII